MTNLIVAVNNDTQDLEYGSSGVNWIDLAFIANLSADTLVFSEGSDTVDDGEAIPSQSDYNQAGTILHPTNDVEVAKCLLADASAGLLREIFNFADNKRYVFCASFDGATASEPVLELWDDVNLNSRDLNSLGLGVAGDSWWKGAVTTDGLPGASWAGTPLAGNADGYFLWLNNENGVLGSGGGELYFNLKIVIPGGLEVSGLEQPVMAIKYLAN